MNVHRTLVMLVVASMALLAASPAAAQSTSGALMIGQTPIMAGALVAGEPNATRPLPGRAIALASGRAYVAAEGTRGSTHCASSSKFAVFEPVAGAAPRLLGTLDLGGVRLTDVAVRGDYAYLTTGPDLCAQPTGSLRVVDVRDPSAPSSVVELQVTGWGSGTTTTWLSSIALNGAYAYSAVEGGLQAFDLTDPARPALGAKDAVSGGLSDVRVNGAYGYATDTAGLRIYDLANPAQPVAVSSFVVGDAPGSFRGGRITIAGNRLYLIRGDVLRVLDITDPVRPSVLGSVALPPSNPGLFSGPLSRATPSGTTLYVADGQAGLVVVDVADPAHPTISWVAPGVGHSWDAAVDSTGLLVANSQGLAAARHPTAVFRTVLPWSERQGTFCDFCPPP